MLLPVLCSTTHITCQDSANDRQSSMKHANWCLKYQHEGKAWLLTDWLDIICIMSHELPCTSAYQTSVGNQSLGFKAAHCTSAYVYCQTPSVIIATIHRNSSSFQWVDFTISCYKWFNYSELCFDQSTKYTVTGHKTKCSGRHMSARLSNVKNDILST